MCGILGVIPSIETNKFEKALDLIKHRGPDGSGVWHSEELEITLGHRRLSIIDLSENASQPMVFGDYTITFNGEIYNFLEIKKELELVGITFSTKSDTEVLLKAFIHWGSDCLLKFNGMWSLAIWNSFSKTLFLSRDRFGKKPLFYAFTKNRFVFASEMKAIMPFLDKIEVSDNFDFCNQHIFDYENTDKTLVKGIKRFPKGSFTFLKKGFNEVIPVKFWETRDHLHAVPKRYEEQVEVFRSLFLDACKIRMRSDVPIGTALSGGLDSSATICSMAHIDKSSKERNVNRNWQHAFIASFEGSFLDETVHAKEVIDYLGIPGHFVNIDPVKGIEKIQDYLFYQEDLYLTSPIPMMELYGLVRKNNVFVTLDGHGADELFSGYSQDILLGLIDAGNNQRLKKYIIDAYQDMSPRNVNPNQFYQDFSIKKHGGKFNMFKSNFARNIYPKRFENPQTGKLGALNEHLYALFHNSILPTLLRNYDRYSMANGVEIRMPFMDYRLVTYSFSIPWSSKVQQGFTKSIVRDALEDIMPKNIVRRKDKIGFNTPIVEYLKGAWKEFYLDTLNSADFKNNNLIDYQSASENLNEIFTNENPPFWRGEYIWNDFQPYFWYKGFIENPLIQKAHRSIHE